jgi:Glycosyl transferase family 11
MISFSKLGNYGRLGNQLFQYAFLRVTAQRLNTNFFCPAWEGDQIFDLKDEETRAVAPDGILHHFDPTPEAGFCPRALGITDYTEIQGFFQSDKYYPDKAVVRSWYSFRPEIVHSVESLFPPSLLEDAVSISLRLDNDYANTREYFPLYPPSYYRRGLSRTGARGPVLVFADRPDLAKTFIASLDGNECILVEGLSPHQQLYLMTRCRANVITNSTFAWWGAWLNSRDDRVIVAPSAWCRPGVPNGVSSILPDEWIKVRGTLPFWDNFQMWRIRHLKDTLRRIESRRRH